MSSALWPAAPAADGEVATEPHCCTFPLVRKGADVLLGTGSTTACQEGREAAAHCPTPLASPPQWGAREEQGSGPLGSLQLRAVQQGFSIRQCTAKPNERSCLESTKCPYSSQNGNFVRCPRASQGKHKPHACRGTGAQTLLLLM